MFKLTAATIFLVAPLLALVLGMTAGLVPALVSLLGLPVLAVGVTVARLAMTRSGREKAANLQNRSEDLRESLR